MSSNSWDNKDPNDVIQYNINWTKPLNEGETIAAVTHSVSTAVDDLNPLAIDTSKPSSGEIVEGLATKVWLKGGSNGNTYYVTAEITTSTDRVFNRKVRLRVKDL